MTNPKDALPQTEGRRFIEDALPICDDPPQTPTGIKLFTDIDPLDMWESNGVTQEDVRAVELEAASETDFAAAVGAAVERAELAESAAYGFEADLHTAEAQLEQAASREAALVEAARKLDTDCCCSVCGCDSHRALRALLEPPTGDEVTP
jgi:hypothetical protein